MSVHNNASKNSIEEKVFSNASANKNVNKSENDSSFLNNLASIQVGSDLIMDDIVSHINTRQ